ncbi:MAG TPA: hemolysin family protein [Candidatus Acidoferrales bacterium]|jgi:CBS domain containing-hemolysin-like protein|nr:hemolysin family protein [Candidatus Acidoferrales bacterium]
MIGLRLLAVLMLVAINGFFASAEFALVAVRASRVRQLIERGDPRARIVQQLLTQLDRVVSGVQVGITLTSLAIGAIGEPLFAQLFRPLFEWLPGGRAALAAHGVAIVLAFACLTLLHVVFGELVPKTISLERAARASLLIARPFYWYLSTFRWAVVLLEGISGKVVRWLGVSGLVAGHTIPHSAEELQVQIRQAGEHGLLAPGEERVILGALDLREIRVRDIMIPRPDVHALPVEAGFEETLALFAKTQRSRLPVYQSSLDHVLGFVHIKDLLGVLSSREEFVQAGSATAANASGRQMQDFSLRRFLRELLIVPEGKLAGDLLLEMRTRRISLAMVVDEFGSILGLVTLEDVLEQMVGEIHDEFDIVQAPQIVGSGPELAMVFDGAVGLRDLETQYEISLPEDPAYATLGGFVLAQLGFIPRGGESFDFAGYRFTVLEMERHRVARIKLQRLIVPSSAVRGVRHPASAG